MYLHTLRICVSGAYEDLSVEISEEILKQQQKLVNTFLSLGRLLI